MKQLLTVALTVILLGTCSGILLDGPCPAGCADTICNSLGCTNCMSNWCRLLGRDGSSVCVPHDSCGEAKYCYRGLCAGCVTLCKTCSGLDHCKECAHRYYLDDSSSSGSKCVSSYECQRSGKQTHYENGINVCR